jgi:hypothetical protein
MGRHLACCLLLLLAAAACRRRDRDPDPPPAPSLLAIAPTQGPTAGGTLVTLTGAGLSTVDRVTFGGVAAAFSIPSDAALVATTPAAAAGAVDVSVWATPWGFAATEPGGFQYLAGAAAAPTVSAASPGFGVDLGGQVVTVTGTGFQAGATVQFGANSATGVVVHGASRLSATTPAGTPGPANVTVTNPDAQAGTLSNGYLYISPNAQTAQYVFDTATGIDCRRRWFVNFGHTSFWKDLQNAGLQSWGTPGDATAPPAPLPAVDQLALDWVRAYTLSTLNVCFGRNTDGSKVSSTSINCTFVGLFPGSGGQGCATPAADWGMLCVGGCDPNGNGGPHPSASQAACTMGALGAMAYDTVAAAACNSFTECGCDATYHQAGCQTAGTGIFAALVVNTWGASVPGGRLTASDVPYLDGTTTVGLRYTQLHTFMQQLGHRIAFIAAHEIGHAFGLVASNATGNCAIAPGLCNSQSSSAHNDCCSNNLMQSAATFLAGPLLTATSAEFSGKPGSSVATGCNLGGLSSWANLQAFVGLSP